MVSRKILSTRQLESTAYPSPTHPALKSASSGLGRPRKALSPYHCPMAAGDCQSLRRTCSTGTAATNYFLTGTGGPGGKDFVIGTPCCAVVGVFGVPVIELKEGGECGFSLDLPSQLWACPWVIVTGCMGACCVECMKCGPKYLVQMNGAECGEVHSLGGCGDVIVSDPAALHGALLCLAFNKWYDRFGPVG